MARRLLLSVPEDWDEEQDGYSLMLACIPNSPHWHTIYYGLMRRLTWWTVWSFDGASVNEAKSQAEQAYRSVIMADLQNIEQSLDRMATALEQIRDRTPELVSLEDLIGDIQTGLPSQSLSVIAPIIDILASLSGLLPNLKVDATKIILDIFDKVTFKWPLLERLEGIAQGVKLIAAAELGEGAMAAITVLQDTIKGWGNMFLGIKDVVLGGTWNLFDNVISPLWDLFIGIPQGGTHDDIPDKDKTLRAVAFWSVNFDCMCANAGGAGCDCGAWGGSYVDDPAAEEQPGPDIPPTSWDRGQDEFVDNKCRAASWLTQAYIDYILGLESPGAWVTIASGSGLAFLFSKPAIAILAAPLMVALGSYLATVIVGFSSIVGLMSGYRSNLQATQGATIGNLTLDLSVDEARVTLQAWVSDNSPIGLPSDWVERHVDALFTNQVLNVLFSDNHGIQEILDYPPNPSCSLSTVAWTFDFSTDGWVYDPLGTHGANVSEGVHDINEGALRASQHKNVADDVEGHWAHIWATPTLTLAATSRFRFCLKWEHWCATGFRLQAVDDMGNLRQFTGVAPVDGQYHTYEFTAGNTLAGAKIKELRAYTSIGPACQAGAGGQVQMLVDYVELQL